MAQLIRFAAACAAALLCQYAAAQESTPVQASPAAHREAGPASPAATRPVIKVDPIAPFGRPDPRDAPHGLAAREHLQAGDTEPVAPQCRRLWVGIPAAHPQPCLINVERARERFAALPPPAPAPQE